MPRPQPTVLCAAEPWGFGPASKLFAIARSLSPRPRLVVAAAGSAAAFARANRDIVDEVIQLETPYEILALDRSFDAVVTVMDPWAALLGARRGVPVAYVDSLFWFWKWDGIDFGTIPEQAQRWVSADLEALREMTAQPLNWHVIVPLAYFWSDRVYAQRTPGADGRAKLFPDGRIELVGAVITGPAPAMNGTSAPLVSVSGAVSHVTPVDVALRYAQLVRKILLSSSHLMPGATITGNAAVLPVFLDGPWRVHEMGLSTMHAAMAQAQFLAAPAGLTTCLEAAALGTPVIILPEQHGGHARNMEVLSVGDPGAYDDILLRRWFDLTRSDPHEAVADLDECYRRIMADREPDIEKAIIQAFQDAAASLSDPRTRAERVQRQRNNVLRVVGDFDGAHAVASSFLLLLATGAVSPG